MTTRIALLAFLLGCSTLPPPEPRPTLVGRHGPNFRTSHELEPGTGADGWRTVEVDLCRFEVEADLLKPGDEPIVILKHRLRYAGRNGFWPVKAAMWIALWAPAWWIAADEIEAECEVRRGDDLGIGLFRARIDDFDCGFKPFGMFWMPECLSERDWSRIAWSMMPEARRRALISLREKE